MWDGAAIVGHAHEEVKAALHAQIERGTSFGAPCEMEVSLSVSRQHATLPASTGADLWNPEAHVLIQRKMMTSEAEFKRGLVLMTACMTLKCSKRVHCKPD